MSTLGELAIALAILAATASLTACLAAARFASTEILRIAHWSLAATAAAFVAASGILLAALINGHFEFEYVARFTDRALPLGYKLAAFWAGQEGSLLLWAVLLAVMSSLAVFTGRGQTIVQSSATTAVLAAACAFFGFLLLLAADPFTVSSVVPADGNGLNPMLRDPAMIAHPPILFLGYAGFTVPFALLAGALIARVRDERWLAAARGWTLFSFLALSGGILLGAKWAYIVLGWGGYWAWDPVENASLLPWLTGVALLHSLIIQRQRGMFRASSAVLTLLTFVLCIFGTYITRSGIVDSVHSFGQSLVGTFFLVLIVATTIAGAGLLLWRRKLLCSDHEMTGLIGREGAFAAANILLVAMATVVLAGTMFPVISAFFGGARTTPQPQFYDRVAGPIAFLVAALMAVGPLLHYGPTAARALGRGILVPAALAAAAAAIVFAMGIRGGWAMACAAIAAGAVATVALDLYHRRGALFTNHRRYGAQLTHLGVVMLLVGITGSSVFSSKQSYQLNPGDSVAFAGRTLKLDQISEDPGTDCSVVSAIITVTEPDGGIVTLQPQRRFFDKWDDQPNSVVAIHSTWTRDLYVTLAGWDETGKNVAIEAIENPLVCWIWVGGIVLIAGGFICILPRLEPARSAGRVAARVKTQRICAVKSPLGRLS
ncbi:MAG TPA: cytochrome c-type biogenesis CcmF C-terminal domain-containing protein [Tepidisphaeraceae bacterium]|nr:cytochrome c-type biogenesis CcmF C-terminal domain-containing protein [Tepidisphaeraceae bacterium]